MNFRLLKSPFENDFSLLLKEAKNELTISSPFINVEGVKILSSAVKNTNNLKLHLLTNLSVRNIFEDVTQPTALLEFYDIFEDVTISSLNKLHSKVYVVDNDFAVVTSANLTSGGLLRNYEYGILVDDRTTVTNIRKDILDYSSLGNILDKDLLIKIHRESKKIDRIKFEKEKRIKNSALSKLLKQSEKNLEVELLKNRIKEGKTINSIFSETILYLLKKKGALSTIELNPLIQSIHSDICDDSIDRIINGQHFGRKWKHSVRNAQQALKSRNIIFLKGDGRWYLKK